MPAAKVEATSPSPETESTMTRGDKETMTQDEKQMHLGFMREALAMATLALESGETPVGCVFVHDGRIIGRGMNATNRSYNGTRHAEFIGIDDILTSTYGQDGEGEGDGEGRRAGLRYGPEVLRETDLYVTIEPCIMCASLLRQVGIRKVYFGAGNERFGGTGGVLNVHVRNGGPESETGAIGKGELVGGEGDYEVSGGWMREEAIVSLRRFYVGENERAPEEKARGKKERVLRLDVEPLETRKMSEDG